MSRHLAEETFAELLEGAADAAARRHVRECARCAERLAEGEAGLARARRGGAVPEPPAPYWEALRRNVGRRIAAGSPQPSHRLAWLVPVAASAALVAIVIGRQASTPPSPAATAPVAAALPAWTALPPLEQDDAVPLLEGVLVAAGSIDADEGAGADAYVAGLSEDESSALARALSRANDGTGGEDL